MADVALLAGGTQEAPLDYVIPGAQEIVPKAVTASYDGSGAAGDFVPTLQVIAPNGTVLANCPLGQTVTAGASVDVSWFPRGGVGGGTGGGIEFNKDNEGGWLYAIANNVGPDLPFGSGVGLVIGETTGSGAYFFSGSSIVGAGAVLQLFGGDGIVAPQFALATPAEGGFGADDSFPRVSIGIQNGGNLQVLNHLGQRVFQVDPNGALHGKAGQALTFDLP